MLLWVIRRGTGGGLFIGEMGKNLKIFLDKRCLLDVCYGVGYREEKGESGSKKSEFFLKNFLTSWYQGLN